MPVQALGILEHGENGLSSIHGAGDDVDLAEVVAFTKLDVDDVDFEFMINNN